MAKVEIQYGNELAKLEDQHLLVMQAGYPSFQPQKIRPFRQYMTVDGTPDASNDMSVDGSVTEQEFCVSANGFVDRYITNISVIVAYGTSGQPYEWADGTPLTNGVRLYYTYQLGEIDIHDGFKTNQDLFRLSHSQIDSSWQVNGVNANNDFGYFITIDLESFMPPYGVKLDKGSSQKLAFTIRDNVGLAADTFNAIAYGFDRFE